MLSSSTKSWQVRLYCVQPLSQVCIQFSLCSSLAKNQLEITHNGNCCLESTMLRTPEHLSRLTLVVAYLFDWLISAGAHAIHIGLRHLVDRKDRRDLSLFQIGWRFVERYSLRLLPIPLALCTYF